jgi:hypothetical protein
MISVDPSHSINSGCEGCTPLISSIIAPSAKTSPAVAIGHPTTPDTTAFSFGFMFHCHLLIPARHRSMLLNYDSIHITGKKKCRRRERLRGITSLKSTGCSLADHSMFIKEQGILATHTLSTHF